MSAPGFLLPSELITVQSAGNVQMATKAGKQFLAFRDWLKTNHNITLGIALPAGGYRSHAMDVDMHNNPLKYNINPAIGLLPVGSSKHALGICFDAVPTANATVNANAHLFGFWRPIAVDINHFQYDGTTTSGNATPIPTPAKRYSMTTIYHDQSTLVAGAVKDGTTLFALAGDSPGTPANWLETRTYALVQTWASAHGSSSLLSPATFQSFKAAYTAPLQIAGSTGGGGAPTDLTPVLSAIAGVPKAVNDDAAARLAN